LHHVWKHYTLYVAIVIMVEISDVSQVNYPRLALSKWLRVTKPPFPKSEWWTDLSYSCPNFEKDCQAIWKGHSCHSWAFILVYPIIKQTFLLPGQPYTIISLFQKFSLTRRGWWYEYEFLGLFQVYIIINFKIYKIS
jgi:hypothetical protein